MGDDNDGVREITCPHCHREFSAELLGAGGLQGYKCPHCRLFVPLERVAESDPAEERAAP